MNAHRTVRRLPDPWLFDSKELLRELARIRGLVLQIPHRNENVLPINTVVDSVWRLEEQLQFLIGLQATGQREFAKKAQVEDDQSKAFDISKLKVIRTKA